MPPRTPPPISLSIADEESEEDEESDEDEESEDEGEVRVITCLDRIFVVVFFIICIYVIQTFLLKSRHFAIIYIHIINRAKEKERV